MSAELEIANLKARYCAAADLSASDEKTAREQFSQIFAHDFVGNYGMEPLIGASAITDFLCTAIGGSSQWMVHMLSSPLITVKGDAATGDWTVLVHSRRRESGAAMEVIGRYSDEFRRTPEGWRITKVRFSRPES